MPHAHPSHDYYPTSGCNNFPGMFLDYPEMSIFFNEWGEEDVAR